VVAAVASFGGLNPAPGALAHALAPAAPAPSPQAPTHQVGAQPSASSVAFAPAAMSALIEAQERLNQDAPMFDRLHTADKIDLLLVRLAGSVAPVDPAFDVRRLETARQALSLSAPVGATLALQA